MVVVTTMATPPLLLWSLRRDGAGRGPDMISTSAEPRTRALLWAYRLFPLLLLPLMLVLSRDFGVTWDEKTHQLYGERVFRFLTERLDDDWFRPGGEIFMYLVGGLFDTLCVAVQQVIPGDAWVTRHYVNAVFGWLGILYVGRLGRLLSGPGTGLLAMVLLTLSPRYFGDAMNNPKDLPLAALLAAALYYLMRLEPRYPYLGWRVAVPLALSIGMAVNVRSGALIFLAYLAIALSALTIAAREFSPGAPRRHVLAGGGRRRRRPAAGDGVLAVGPGPAAHASGAGNAQALPVPVDVPGALQRRRRAGERPALGLRSAVGAADDATGRAPGRGALPPSLPSPADPRRFPLAGARPVGRDALSRLLHRVERSHDLRRGPAPAVHLPAPRRAGRRRLAGSLESPSRKQKTLAAVALGLGLLEPAVFHWRNHPNQAVYFNALAGGPRGAFGRYELDYWGNSLLQGARWADGAARASGIRLVVSGAPHHVVRDDVRRFGSLEYAREDLAAHHLALLVLRGPRQDVLDLARRTDILYAVTTADGTPLTVVVPGPRYAEVEEALRKALPSLPRLTSP